MTNEPVLEPPVETPVTPPEPQAPQSLLANIRVLGRAQDAPNTPEATTPVEPPKDPVGEPQKPEEPVTPEDPKPEPKPEVKPEVKPDPTTGMSEKASARFRNMEKHKVEAEQERDRVKKELDAQKAEFETLKKQASELERISKDAQKAIEEAKTYKEQLRAASIERDPEFQKQYNGQIISKQTQMMELAVSAGTDRNEFIRAINSGDEDALEGFRDSLPASKQRLWDAHRVDIEKLAYERTEAVKNSDKTWAQMEEDRKRRAAEEQEHMRFENMQIAHEAVEALWKEIPDMEKVDMETKEEIETWLKSASSVLNAPREHREHILKNLAVGAIAFRAVGGQAQEITRLNETIAAKDKELEELQEKLGEQETFIKEASSRTPRPNVMGNSSPATENGSLLGQIRVRLPGQ